MLRALKMEAGMMSAGRAKAMALRVLRLLFTAGAMLAMCGARPVPGLAPLGMAFFASAVTAGANAGALLAGGLAASFNRRTGFDLAVPLGMAIVLGGNLIWDGIGKHLRPGPSPPGFRRMLARSVLAGMGILLPGLGNAGGGIWPSIQAVCAAATAACCAPFMGIAMEIEKGRRFFTGEERTGMAVMLCALSGGMSGICAPIGAAVSVWGLLAAHPCGAALGIAMGITNALCGGARGLFALLCVGGLTAQLSGDGRSHARAMFTAAACVCAAVFTGLSWEFAGASAVGAGVYMIMPPGARAVSAHMAKGPGGACDPDRLAARMGRRMNIKLRALSEAFGELAEGYLRPCDLPDEQALMNRMRDRLCSGCGDYARCWSGTSHGARFLCGLIAGAVEWADTRTDAPMFEAEAPPELLRQCRRGRAVAPRLSDILEDFALTRRAELKRGSENRLISAQFLQAQRMLEAMAEEQARPVRLRDRQAARAAVLLERMGMCVDDVMMLGSPRVEIIAALKAGKWTRETAEAASVRFSRAFGRVYVPEGENGREMRFARRPGYRVEIGVGCVPREAGTPSGDSHLSAMIDDERMLMLICDGMGSGEAAARESAGAVRLLAKFLKAGVDSFAAIETVNALLLNRSGEDMFATVDMLILDLSTGMAEFVKLAACPSLVLRGGDVLRVEGGRLPLGILEKVQPAVTKIQLLPGDIVLMASDGVMDAVDGRIEEAAGSECPPTMQAMARRILNFAEGPGRARRRDDMTVLCARFSPRRIACRAG